MSAEQTKTAVDAVSTNDAPHDINSNMIQEDRVTLMKTVKNDDKLSIFGYIRLIASEKYELYIPPSIIDFIVLYTYFMTNLVQIPLRIQSHKGQFGKGWQVNYLLNDSLVFHRLLVYNLSLSMYQITY